MSQPSGCSGRDVGGISPLPTLQPVRCQRFQRAARALLVGLNKNITLQTPTTSYNRQVYFKVDYFETFKSTLRGDEILFSVSLIICVSVNQRGNIIFDYQLNINCD